MIISLYRKIVNEADQNFQLAHKIQIVSVFMGVASPILVTMVTVFYIMKE